MDYKYEVGEKVIFDGTQVAEILGREHMNDVNLYKIRLEGRDDCWSVTINENRLDTALPGRIIQCECGADSILGKYNAFHAEYCRKYVKSGLNR